MRKKKKSKLRVIKVVGFVFALIIVLKVVGELVRPKELGQIDEETIGLTVKGFQDEKEKTIDSVFVGSSYYYRGIIPMDLYENKGITSYVYSTSGQRIPTSYYYLKNVFRTQKPELVFVSADLAFDKACAADGNISSSINNLPNNSIKYEAMFDKNNYGGMLSWINTIFPIIPYHNRINNLVDEDYSNFMVYKGHSVSKGFLPVYTVKPCENVEYMDKELDGYSSIPKVADKYYTKMKKLCEENKSKLIILQLPAYTAWNNKRHEATKEYAKKKDIEFVDLNLENDEVGIDYKVDTYDKGEHLNYSGAKKVTKYIGDYIDKKHKLKDHRKEKGYEKWEEDLGKYKEKTEKTEKDFCNSINKENNKKDENKKERLSKHKTR